VIVVGLFKNDPALSKIEIDDLVPAATPEKKRNT
jgi:hypothetical protein